MELDEYSGTPDPKPPDPDWVGITGSTGSYRTDGDQSRGVTFHNYSADSSHWGSSDFDRLNNMSRLTVVNCLGFKLVSAGDLLKKGIEGIMENEEAMNACEDAQVLVAPHHGKESSYVSDFVSNVNPDLVVFSEKSDEDHTVPDKYRNHANGYNVENEKTGESEERKILTTRANGRIRIEANTREDWQASFYRHRTSELANSRNYTKNSGY